MLTGNLNIRLKAIISLQPIMLYCPQQNVKLTLTSFENGQLKYVHSECSTIKKFNETELTIFRPHRGEGRKIAKDGFDARQQFSLVTSKKLPTTSLSFHTRNDAVRRFMPRRARNCVKSTFDVF